MASPCRIAVASNFHPTLIKLKAAFEKEHPEQIQLIPGSTGRLYAQIKNGAPFDAFFSADSERPILLEKAGHSQPNTRFTYALGILALWNPSGQLDLNSGLQILNSKDIKHIAIANPKLAPYGAAALQTLNTQAPEEAWTNLVLAENISQAYHFIHTGNAEIGFVSYSQLLAKNATNFQTINPSKHSPITQQAILITKDKTAAAFLEFCKSNQAQFIILKHGYKLPK